MTKNTTSSGSGSGSTAAEGVRSKAGYLFKAATVDAKYQNAYSYKAESSSTIKITVVPTPAPQPLLDAIKVLVQASPAVDTKK